MPVLFDDLPDEELATGGLAFDDLPDERPKPRRVVDAVANPNRPLAPDEVPDYSGAFARDIPIAEAAMRNLAIGGERFNQFANFLGGGLGTAVEAIPGVQPLLERVTGNRRALSETGFAGVNDAARQIETLSPQRGERESLPAKVVGGVAQAAPDVALAILTGGESLGAQAAMAPVRTTAAAAIREELERSALTAARASVLPGGTRGVELGRQVLDAGGTPLEAGTAGLQGAAATALTNVIPASASGSALLRAGQGLAANPAADLAQQELENLALPDRLQLDQTMTPDDLIVSALIGAPLAAGLGERGPDRINDPAAMRAFAPPAPAPAPAANPLADAIGAAMRGDAVDLAGLAAAVAPPPQQPATPATPARTGGDAAGVIDRRLAALREAATGADEGRVRELLREQDELEALVREQDRLDAANVMRGTETRLTGDERAAADRRRLEVRAELEGARGARDAATQLTDLERRLARIDSDADLVRLADELEPPRSPSSPPAAPAPREQPRVEAKAEERPEPQGAQAPQEPAPAAAVPAAEPARAVNPLAPRRPGETTLPADATREQLVQAWRDARTPDTKAEAAARIAAFDQRQAPSPAPASRAQPAAPVTRTGDSDAEVSAALGPAARGVTIVRSKADLPREVVDRYGINEASNDNVEGFYDPDTGVAYVIESDLDTSAMPAAARKVWVAAHERAGHAGLRGMFVDRAGSSSEGSRALRATLDRAEQNPTVAALAEALRRQRPGDAPLAVEEALSELAAAVRTGDFDHLRDRYGVDVPQAQRATVRGYIERLVQQIKRALGLGDDVPDAEVYRLIEDANRYVRENPEPRGTSRRARNEPLPASRAMDEDLELDDDFGGFENNASGESAASLEAIGRVREERDLGRVRMLIDRDGTVRPIVGVDAVDTFARPGQIIVQRNIGRGDEWTAISTDPSLSRDAVAGRINAARSRLADALVDDDDGVIASRRKGEGDGQADQPASRRRARPQADREPGAGDENRQADRRDDGAADVTKTPAFKRWFRDSKVVDDNGEPLVVYHGSGTNIEAFDPALTGQGNDQIGSGFYFTTNRSEAQGYTTAITGNAPQGARKLGGDDAPTVIDAYLSIQKPIEVRGSNLTDTDVNLTKAQAEAVIRRAPLLRDEDDSPMGNWHDIWGSGGVQDWMIRDVAKHYAGPNLISLEADWFRGDATAFRHALRDVLGYDGVVMRFDNGTTHWVAWFPEQVKSASANSGNFDPEDTRIIASRRRGEGGDAVDTSPGGPREFKVGNTTIEYGIGRDGSAEVILVRTPPAHRRQGGAREAMRRFLEQTDAAGLEVRLTASPIGAGGASKSALERFYRDLGFKPNKGRSRDFTTRHTLIRRPGGAPIASRRSPAQAQAERQQRLNALAHAGMPQGTPVQAVPGGRFEPVREAVDRARQKLQDSMLPVRRAQERAVAAKGGGPSKAGVSTWSLDDTLNAYRLENLMHGRAKDRTEAADQELIQPMQQALRRTGLSLEQLSDYVYALHAPERNAQVAKVNRAMPDAGSGITTQRAKDILAGNAPGPYSGKKLSRDDVTKLAAIYQRNIVPMRERTLDFMVEGQQITPALARQLRQVYPNYVPMRGKESEFEVMAGGTGKGLSGKRSPIKRALGRGDDNIPVNVIGELVGDLQRAIVAAEKARVNQAFLKFALENPMDDLFKVEPVDLEWKYSDATGEAYLGVRSRGEDAERVMTVMHNGEPVNIRFEDPALRDAVLNMGAEDTRALVRIVGAVNRWRSAVLTRFNPAFPAVNILRDLNFGLTGAAAERGLGTAFKSAGTYPAALRALWRDQAQRRGNASVPNARKSWDDWAREYAESGAKTGITIVDDPAKLQRRLSDASLRLMQLAADGRPFALAKESVVRTLKPVAETIERVNDATENALRLAVYRDQRLKGESVEKAAEYAKNLTINFNRKGSWGPALNALYLFYNASVQGTHAVQRVLRRPGVQAYLGGLLGLQAYLAMQMMDEDEDLDGITAWDTVPDYVKRTSLVIPLGSMTGNQRDYFALPMPYGFNLAPYLGGRGMQHYRFGKRPTDASLTSDMVKSATEAFSPLPLGEGYGAMFGDTLGFAMQMAANRDDLGRQIAQEDPYADYQEPRALTGRADTPRAYQAAAQLLAKAGGGDLEQRIPPVGYLDVAPEQIEATVGYMAGGLGNLGNKSQRWWEQLDADNYENAMDVVTEAPIVSRLVGRGNAERAVAERYYGERGELARKMDVLQDRLERSDDPDAVLREAGESDRTLGGLSAARRKRKGKGDDQAKGSVKRTSSGGVQLQAEDASTVDIAKDVEKQVKGLNKAIKSVRNPEATNADIVAAVSGVIEDQVEGALGLPAGYDESATAPNRVRQRAIKALQRARREAQQRLLKSLRLDRSLNRAREQLAEEDAD